MTDNDAFIARIIDDPADDTARLVYADWLEERAGEAVPCERCEKGRSGWRRYTRQDYPEGKPEGHKRPRIRVQCEGCSGTGRVSDGRRERAEFIRVQCELGDETHEYCKDDYCVMTQKPCRVVALRRRERELWRNSGDRGWWDTVPGTYRATLDRDTQISTGEGWIFKVRRGFVATVAAPLAVLFGGPCEACRGTGDETSDGQGRCGSCRGTGTTAGCAADLFRCQPVERVTLTDREPFDSESSDRWIWFEDGGGRVADDPSALPRRLFDLLEGAPIPRQNFPRSHKQYPTRAAALDALSLAACRRGRRLAGLDKVVV